MSQWVQHYGNSLGDELFCGACGSALIFGDTRAKCVTCNKSFEIGEFANKETSTKSAKFVPLAAQIVYTKSKDDNKGAIVSNRQAKARARARHAHKRALMTNPIRLRVCARARCLQVNGEICEKCG